MGNFDFVKHTQPSLFEDARRAESYVTTDARSAAFYARRTAELLVEHLYDVWGLPEPYKSDFSARMHAPAFMQKVPQGIRAKLDLIRKNGNNAVHRTQAIPTQVGFVVLDELFHVLVWAGFHASPFPDAVPLNTKFDPKLAAKAAPLTRDQVQDLAQKFKQQDEAHEKALAEKDDLLAAQAFELEALKAQIAAAQQHNVREDDHDYSEAETRQRYIDELLLEAGWTLSDERDREYPVTGMPSPSSAGYVDYVLWGTDGKPLALVEAKRTTKSVETGRQQAKLYADALEAEFGRRPVIYFSNGYEHRIWDDAADYPARFVEGFYTRDELELLVQRRTTRKPLAHADVDSSIAGRPYQQRAIHSVGAAFDNKQRSALLVMATGAGKTRTTIALVDQLMREGWVKNVLFLADRTALVNQAAREFATHLPKVATVNLLTEKSGVGRVYAATYPTILNLINQVDDNTRRFGPGFFDLVVIDEAHRSVYAKYGAIFDYFDSLLVGLTATPKDEVDHNTYKLFELEDGVPTDAYTLDEAVLDGYLVPPRGVAVSTQFIRDGIRYDELSQDEKDQWDLLDWGDETPDEVDAEAINKFFFNIDTVDKALEAVMDRGYAVAGGDQLGKTIIFAKSQRHAEFISERFDAAFPEKGANFARVITHAIPYAQQLIDDFSDPAKTPHVAITVDMLDTGIDVPDVVNLVFFRPVRSKTKYWQMIGRGTRLRPDLFGPADDKKDFLVFDFCRNIEYFNQDLPGTDGATQKSITHRIFDGRVQLVRLLGASGGALRDSTAAGLQSFVAGMNLTNVIVRKNRQLVEKFATPEPWVSLQQGDVDALAALGALPSTEQDADEYAKRFDLLVLRRQLAQLEDDANSAENARAVIQEIADSLLSKLAIPSVAAQAVLLEEVAGDTWWDGVTLDMLELARLRLRSLVRFVDKATQPVIYTDFADTLHVPESVDVEFFTPGTDLKRFREKAMAFLRADTSNLSLQRLRRNMQLTEQDLDELERMLVDARIGTELQIEMAAGDEGLGVFVRSLVGLDRTSATEAFSAYLDDTKFNANQIRFVQMVVDELTSTGVMEPSRLFESPFTDSAPTGPGEVFDIAAQREIVSILRSVRAHAIPA